MAPEIPKVELHVHLEGTVRPRILFEIAQRNDFALPARTVHGLRTLYEYKDLDHFLRIWALTTACLRNAQDFRQVTLDYAAEAADSGAVYVEAIFSPAEPFLRGTSWDEVFGGYTDAIEEAEERYGVTIRLTPDIYRHLEPEIGEQCATFAVKYRDRGIVGFGLGGSETACPATRHARALAIARDGGLGLVPHAGEAGGADSVREVLALMPVRIRHGIRAAEDPALLAQIADQKIVLDVCPTSNLRTGAVKSLAEHPLPILLQAGVLCSISTDDPAMFGTDLTTEYRIAEMLGHGPNAACRHAIQGVLGDETIRSRLSEIFDQLEDGGGRACHTVNQ